MLLSGLLSLSKNEYMLAAVPSQPDIGQYAIWVIALVLVAFGFSYAKEMIAFVLDKLYEFFIQKNPLTP
jgi:hypothetical protein